VQVECIYVSLLLVTAQDHIACIDRASPRYARHTGYGATSCTPLHAGFCCALLYRTFFFDSSFSTHCPFSSLCLTVKQAIPVCSVLIISSNSTKTAKNLHLPDDFPGEPDVVEQSDKERHADEDVSGIGVGLDKGWSGHQHEIITLRTGTDRLKRYCALASIAPKRE
jgi:hypothetical protein